MSRKLTIYELDELRRKAAAYDRLQVWLDIQITGKDYELCVSDIRQAMEPKK